MQATTKLYRGWCYRIERHGESFAVMAWSGRPCSEERVSAHYFERSTDAARWLRAAIRRITEKKQGE